MLEEEKKRQIVRNRHIAIIEKFDSLMAAEKANNPVRARYISKQYYAHLISLDPVLGLSENYISKIINKRYCYERTRVGRNNKAEL